MATFKFGVTVPTPYGAVESAALGVNAAGKFTDKDLNKAVKLAANNNYVLAATGNDLEAVVVAVDAATVNDGFGFGSVQKKFNHLEVINGDAVPIAVGATIVAGVQAVVGTEQEYPVVIAGAGVLFRWRIKSLLDGTGAVGEVMLAEPIGR